MAGILKSVVGEKRYLNEAEKLFKAIVFNYLVNNGDAHIKNFSVVFNPPQLAPLYDLLNTRLHLPNDGFMALNLFEGGYETPEFEAKGFYSYKDFVEFGKKIGLEFEKLEEFLRSIPAKIGQINDFLNNSALSRLAVDKYKESVANRAKMLI